jgi:hypothetical protein
MEGIHLGSRHGELAYASYLARLHINILVFNTLPSPHVNRSMEGIRLGRHGELACMHSLSARLHINILVFTLPSPHVNRSMEGNHLGRHGELACMHSLSCLAPHKHPCIHVTQPTCKQEHGRNSPW